MKIIEIEYRIWELMKDVSGELVRTNSPPQSAEDRKRVRQLSGINSALSDAWQLCASDWERLGNTQEKEKE